MPANVQRLPIKAPFGDLPFFIFFCGENEWYTKKCDCYKWEQEIDKQAS